MRCFLAVDPPEGVRAAIAAAQDRLREAAARVRVRWVAAPNLHLTLRFLGEVDEGRAGEVAAASGRVVAERAPIAVEAAGMGVFPGPVRPRVVWVGLTVGAAGLGALAGALERALGPLGFPPEARPFRAHLTVGRIRPGERRAAALVRALEEVGEARFGAWTVDDVVLYRSHLGASGSRYEVLARLPLGAAVPA